MCRNQKPIMCDTDDTAWKVEQHVSKDGRGKGTQIARGFIHEQDVSFFENGSEKEEFGFLTSGEGRNGMVHFFPGKTKRAQMGSDGSELILAAVCVQESNRGGMIGKQFLIMLRKIHAMHILSVGEYVREKMHERGFATAVLANNQELFWTAYMQTQGRCEQAVSGPEFRKIEIQNDLPLGQGNPFSPTGVHGP